VFLKYHSILIVVTCVSNKIKRLGIYFSRYAYLRIYDVENFDNEDNDFASFVEWFKERALQEI